jgi:hypothetical protein
MTCRRARPPHPDEEDWCAAMLDQKMPDDAQEVRP